MPDKVYLIGTMHFDLRGPERLEKLLNLYRPNYIITEALNKKEDLKGDKIRDMTLDEFVKRFKEGKPFNLTWNPETVYRFFCASRYEQRITRYYAKKYGIIQVEKDDLPSVNKLNDMKEQMNNDVAGIFKGQSDVKKGSMLDLTPEEFMESMNKFSYWASENKGLDNPNIGSVREKIWEEEIRKQTGIVVGVFGSAHIFGKPHNIYNRLADLVVERIMLCDADNI